VYDNPNCYPSPDQFLDEDGHNVEPMPCLEAACSGGKIADDYEVLPEFDYEQPLQDDLLNDAQVEVLDYVLPTSNTRKTKTIPNNDTLTVGEELPEDEQTYKDPGYIEKDINDWFKQKRICKLDKNNIRCTNY